MGNAGWGRNLVMDCGRYGRWGRGDRDQRGEGSAPREVRLAPDGPAQHNPIRPQVQGEEESV